MKKTIIIVFIAVTFLSGCVARHYVAVDSVVEPSAKVKRYYALLYNTTRPEKIDIEVRKVLASRGLVDISELPNCKEELERLSEELKKISEEERKKVLEKPHIQELIYKCDEAVDERFLIFLDYKIHRSDKQEYKVRGSIQRRGFDIFKGTMLEGSGTDYFSGTITPYTTTKYFTIIILDAFDISSECPISYDEKSHQYKPSLKCPLWRTAAITEYSGNLRRDILFLLGAIEPYIATHTGSTIVKHFNNNERKALELRVLKNEK